MKYKILFIMAALLVLSACSSKDSADTATLAETNSIMDSAQNGTESVFVSSEISKATTDGDTGSDEIASASTSASSTSSTISITQTQKRDTEEINSVHKSYNADLSRTTEQTKFIMQNANGLKIGGVDVITAKTSHQSAIKGNKQTYLVSTKNVYKTETAKSLGSSISETYYDGKKLYTRQVYEDASEPENNSENIMSFDDSSAGVDNISPSYSQINKKNIMAADISEKNGDFYYTFTLDPMLTLDELAQTLKSDSYGLEFDNQTLKIDYNIIKANSKKGYINNLGHTVKFQYKDAAGVKSCILSILYSFNDIGSNKKVDQPSWVK